MSRADFDSVLSGISHDDLLDRQWTEVTVTAEARAKYGSKASIGFLVDALHDLYWSGVEREVAAIFLAFDEIQKIHPEETEDEQRESEEMDGLLLDPEKDQIINEWLKVWTPFGDKPPEDVAAWTIKHGVAAFVKEPLPRRRARSLFQAYGFLDIDFCREFKPPSLRSWGQRPQVEVRCGGAYKNCFVAVQCSQCRQCIRSLVYYKCGKGCKDHSILRNRVKVERTEAYKNYGSDSSLDLDYTLLMESLDKPADYCICMACLPHCEHPKEHMRAVRQFSIENNKGKKEFSRELDVWEDFNTGKSLLSLGSATWEHFVESGMKSSSLIPSTRSMFPAGDTHSAMMFGPLLIENGVTRHPGGAFISLRNIPSFSNKTSEEIEKFLAEESDYKDFEHPDGFHEEKLFRTCYSVAPNRKVYKSSKPRRHRSWLSNRKQVLGGIFSGYTPEYDEVEHLMLDKFLELAETWARDSSTDNSPSQNRALLKTCAKTMVELLKISYDSEVHMNLIVFSERLLKKVKLQYSRLNNNCQQFCKSMLLNDDKFDEQYKHMFPSTPSCIEDTPETRCIRYLMSFASVVSDVTPQGGEATRMATAVNVFDWFPHTDGADIIDHISSLRFKLGLDGQSPDLMLNDAAESLHDEILLKSQSTCLFNLKHNRKCTLTAHLLDCPYDNLSILAMHVHRSRHLYTFQSTDADAKPGYEDFLSVKGPKAWISNRLGVLFRSFLLHQYLRSIVNQFFTEIPTGIPITDIQRYWIPQPTSWARVRHDVRREGNVLYNSNQNLKNTPGNAQGHVYPLFQALTASAPFMQSEAVFNTRWRTLKSIMKAELKGEDTGSDTPWTSCDCRACNQGIAILNCRRAKSHAEDVREAKGTFKVGHPDYTSMGTLRWSFARLQGHEDKEAAESVLIYMPEYFNVPGSGVKYGVD